MKILFVGATGGVGKNVVPILAQKHELSLAALGGGEVDGIPVLPLDITDMQACIDLAAQVKPDVVVNCAISEYRKFKHLNDLQFARDYNESVIEVNIRGTYYLLEAAALAKVGKFVQISSLSIHTGPPVRETASVQDLPQPHNFYACSKLFGDNLARVYSHQRDMSVTCLRLGQPFPLGFQTELEWLKDPRSRSIFVHMDDIAVAIDGAVASHEPYEVHAVTSAADSSWLDKVDVPEIGYRPRYYFTLDGVYRTGASGERELVAAPDRIGKPQDA